MPIKTLKSARRLALLIAGAALLLPAQSTGARPSLTIAIADSSGLRKPVILEMEQQLQRMFLQAGITLNVAGPGDAFRYELRILPGSAPNRGDILGTAVLWNRAPEHASIYTGTIRLMAFNAQWGESELLARVAAHELGHLLLNTPAHSPAGLMRAEWSNHNLLVLPHSAFVFLPADAQRMRDRLQAESSNSSSKVI